MPPSRERRWPLVVAGYGILVTLVAGGSAPIYYLVESSNRPLVVRVAAALILGAVVIHLAKTVRARLDDQALSGFELALEPRRLEPSLDRRFVEIRKDLQFSASNRHYFERVLWPELVALADGAPYRPSREPLVKPSGRLFRRGPSLTTLRKLIAAIEEARG